MSRVSPCVCEVNADSIVANLHPTTKLCAATVASRSRMRERTQTTILAVLARFRTSAGSFNALVEKTQFGKLAHSLREKYKAFPIHPRGANLNGANGTLLRQSEA